MPQDVASLIKECTNGSTKAWQYRARLGLLRSFTDPTKPGRPGFKSVKVIQDFWTATNVKVHELATVYKSRTAIREALIRQLISVDQTVDDCLERFGYQIWSDGLKAPFLTTLDDTTVLDKKSDAETASRVKKAPKATRTPYLRHLIYEDPSDREESVLQPLLYN
jgi:hypothetical protein